MPDIKVKHLQIFPIQKNNKLYCPKCDVELVWNRPKSFLDNSMRGSRGYIYKCPQCRFEYYKPVEFRD